MNMVLTSTLLDKALELLGPNGENWTCNSYARDDSNKKVYYTDPTACKFCMLGALKRAAFLLDKNHNSSLGLPTNQLQPLSSAVYQHTANRFGIVGYNDEEAVNFDDIKSVMEEAKKIALELEQTTTAEDK